MSSWKTVQRKKKGGGRGRNTGSRGGGGGGSGRAMPARNRRRNRSQASESSQAQAPARLPVGASGAPKKARQMQRSRQRRGGGANSRRRKKYTNEEQFEVKKTTAWFDPNLLHNPEEQTSFADEEAVEKIPRSLADKIRKNRERLGMSRDEFSQAINERPNVVAQYEMAQVAANTGVLKKMARVLGVNLGQKAGRQFRKARDERFYRGDS